MNEFYIIAPSNACTDIYPENRANNYTIAWENPIELDGNWLVALTETNVNFTKTSVNSDFGILYTSMTIDSYQYQAEI